MNYADENVKSYVYHEDEGTKGGNSVCSLVYKNFEDLSIIKKWEESGKKYGNALTLVFNNCAVQKTYYYTFLCVS